MTREEAIESLRGILTEAVEFENSVCYVTEEDREPLEMAIKALEQEPCEDCISRQTVLEEFENDQYHLEFCKEHHIERSISMEMVRIRLHDLPPVNPQPKTGHWTRELIRNEKGGCVGAKMICSECGNDNKHDEYMNYCPNCGAKMVEPQESETWNGIHAQITAPKGTFERIFNDTDDDSDI